MMTRIYFLFIMMLACALVPSTVYAVTSSDIMAFWSFDETSGTLFSDVSGNGNEATFGQPIPTALKIGECPALDASYVTSGGALSTGSGMMLGWDGLVINNKIATSMIDIPTVPALNADFAISTWLSDDAWADERGVVAAYNDGAGREWTLGIDTGNLIAGSSYGTATAYSYATSVESFTPGYHHVLAQFTGDSVSALYIDGVLADPVVDGAWAVSSETGFTLGGRNRSTVSYPITGMQIDDFGLIDGTVTETQRGQIAAGASLDTVSGLTLLTHLKMDETTGSTLANTAGSAANLVQWSLLDAQDVSGATTTGVFGAGAEFDGSVEEFAQIVPDNLPSVGSEAFTTTFWLKLADWSSGGDVLSWDKNADERYNVAVNGGRLYVYVNSEADGLMRSWRNVDETGLNLTDGEFAHFAVVVDGDSNIQLYVNGVLQTEDGNTNAYYASDRNLATIGARGRNHLTAVDNVLTGTLDDLAVFQGLLTETEIQTLMNNGVGSLWVTLIPGDTNGDKIVNEADAATLAGHWGQTGLTGGYDDGDFNLDGVVDAADASIMAANWGDHTESVPDVPEPGSIILLLTSLLALVGMRRRRA